MKWYNRNLATATVIPSAYYILPSNGSTIYQTTNAPIQIISYPITYNFLVNLVCNDAYADSKFISSNTEAPQSFSIGGYSGQSCYFQSSDPYAALNNIYFQVVDENQIPTSITFDSPSSGSTFSAGTNVTMELTSIPEAGNFSVQLTCDSLTPFASTITSNTTDIQNFLIPSNFYGNNCVFNISYPIASTNAPIITVTQPVTLLEPNSTRNYSLNTAILVSPIAQVTIPNNLITVRQICGSNTTDYPDITVNTEFYATPPLNYTGTCVFSTLASGLYDAATNVTISIDKGTITIDTPEANSRIAAGSNAEITLTASPDISELTVQLDCGAGMTTSVQVTPNDIIPKLLLVPEDFYGSNCSFSVIDYPSYYDAPTAVNVTITQDLIFSSPANNSVILIQNPIPILMIPGYLDVEDPITLNFTCTNNNTLINVLTTVPLDYQYANSFYGNCELSVLSAPEYFETRPLDFSLKYILEFVEAPKMIANGADFTVEIDTLGPVIPGIDTVDLGLYCDGLGEVEVWQGVNLDEPVVLNLNKSNVTAGPLKCQLRTLPNEFYEEISTAVLVIVQLTPQELEEFLLANGITAGTQWIPITTPTNQ